MTGAGRVGGCSRHPTPPFPGPDRVQPQQNNLISATRVPAVVIPQGVWVIVCSATRVPAVVNPQGVWVVVCEVPAGVVADIHLRACG